MATILIALGWIVFIIAVLLAFSFGCSFIYFLYHLIRYKEREPIISTAFEVFGTIIEAISESSSSIHCSGSGHSSSSGFGGGSSRGGGAGRSF
jgi:uncharacterized membrane protein YgcG